MLYEVITFAEPQHHQHQGRDAQQQKDAEGEIAGLRIQRTDSDERMIRARTPLK